MTGATSPTYSEHAIRFACETEPLIGIVTEPTLRSAATAVLIVVGGPQYRAGSHRQFVQLARALAAGGHTVLRFDCRGMGDSGGDLRPFDGIGADIGAAIGALLRAAPDARNVVLWGLCDAASAALMYIEATADSRVAGLCLANPWVRSDIGLARTQVKHYYVQRLRERGFWLKLLSGKVASSAVAGLWKSLRAASSTERPGARQPGYIARMLRGWQLFGGPVLLLCSGSDYTAKEFLDLAGRDPAWRAVLARPSVQRIDLPNADHTFSGTADAHEAHASTLRWLRGL